MARGKGEQVNPCQRIITFSETGVPSIENVTPGGLWMNPPGTCHLNSRSILLHQVAISMPARMTYHRHDDQ